MHQDREDPRQWQRSAVEVELLLSETANAAAPADMVIPAFGNHLAVPDDHQAVHLDVQGRFKGD